MLYYDENNDDEVAVSAICSVTGIAARQDGIDKMFDQNVNTFWHGTKLENGYQSAVKIAFEVAN